MDDNKKLIEQWGKTNKQIALRIKHRKIILISIAGVIVFFIIFMAVFTSTDLIARPIKSLTSNSDPGEWAMFGRDPTHSGSIDASNTLPQGTVTELLTVNDEIHSAPVVSQGIIYLGTRDYQLYAINAGEGTVRWKFKAGSYIDSIPVVANNVVYFGSNDGNLYALDASNGKKLWEFKTQYAIRSSVAVADGRVYFGADDYFVYALDAASGKAIWRFETGNDIESSPVVANGIVYIGSQDDHFYALDARTGRLRLQYPAGGVGAFSPVEMDGKVYIASYSGLLTAIDGNARNWLWENQIRPNWQSLTIYGLLPNPPTVSGYLWSTKLGGSVVSSPTLAGNTIVLGLTNKVVAMNIQNHTKLWEFATSKPVSGTPATANNMVYVPCENGHLYVLDAATGANLKDILVGAKLNMAPAVVGSNIYLSSQDGKLFSVR